MNSVLYDSWPVPAVERFRDQAVADAVTVEELLEARAQSLAKAIARPLGERERAAWLAPWHSEDRVRSWTAMAGAAAREVPGARLESIPGARHTPPSTSRAGSPQCWPAIWRVGHPDRPAGTPVATWRRAG